MAYTAQEMQDRLRGSYGNKVDLVSSSHWAGGPIEALYSPTGDFGNATKYTVPESEFGSWTPPSAQPTLKDVEPYVYTPYELKPPEITPTPAPEYKAPTAYTPSPEATVEGRLPGILSSGSPYIQGAQQRAKEYAASRGLLNTSMAATAGERAAIESALPIAQQDAGAFQEAGMLGYQGEITGATAAQKHGQDVSLVGEQAKYSSILAGQTAEQEAVTADKLAVAKKQLLAMGGEIDAATAAKLADINASAAEKLAAVNEATDARRAETDAAAAAVKAETDAAAAKAQAEIDAADRSSGEKKQAATTVAELGARYLERIVWIQSNPDLTPTAKAELVAQAKFEYEQNVKNVMALYGFDDIVWEDQPGPGEPGGPPAPPAPPGPGEPVPGHGTVGEKGDPGPLTYDDELGEVYTGPGSGISWERGNGNLYTVINGDGTVFKPIGVDGYGRLRWMRGEGEREELTREEKREGVWYRTEDGDFTHDASKAAPPGFDIEAGPDWKK